MIRYAITYHNDEGMRQCLGTARNNYDTEQDAQKGLGFFFLNNSPKVIESFGKRSSFRIDPVECYDHGERKSPYIDDPYCPMQKEWHDAGVCNGEDCGFCEDNKKEAK